MAQAPVRANGPDPGVLAADGPQSAYGLYEPRAAGQSPLFKVLQAHLLDFLAEARQRSDGAGLPAFVEQELREIFAPAGRAPMNDGVVTSLTVAPGATVIFGTGSGVDIFPDSDLGYHSSRRSARILSTSKKLAC